MLKCLSPGRLWALPLPLAGERAPGQHGGVRRCLPLLRGRQDGAGEHLQALVGRGAGHRWLFCGVDFKDSWWHLLHH